jgi:hypothetical protein
VLWKPQGEKIEKCLYLLGSIGHPVQMMEGMELSKTDGMVLDDKRLDALQQLGAISATKYQHSKAQRQYEHGTSIMQDTLKNLSSSSYPRFFE